jgi:hypothetical protein
MPNTVSKYKEDQQVRIRDTPFDIRLQKYIDHEHQARMALSAKTQRRKMLDNAFGGRESLAEGPVGRRSCTFI